MVPSSNSLATRDYSANGYSSRTGESKQRPYNGNIEEAESSLREGSCLNYEEARALLGRLEIKFDAFVADHLSYSLSVVEELRGLADQIEEILPGDLDRDERYYSLALYYYGEGEDLVAFNLLKNTFSHCYWLQSDISGMEIFLLGVSLSSYARILAVSNFEKIIRQSQVLEALEIGKRTMRETDPKVIFHLTLENAELRKLDVDFCYAKVFLRLQVESNIKGWVLLACIFSTQKEFKDVEIVINNALKETGKWD
ncbi:hypothetical protein GIB67_017205 [Kingdonia uniflora]|uniref:Uncharacterized protein n=1 Tax=Kingdonia uniflora TaxID=39325 RepID=A0A7J7NL14_9MAGN|nr:hypothetical protein GIB67_017205 [Kingdonia uniflora]